MFQQQICPINAILPQILHGQISDNYVQYIHLIGTHCNQQYDQEHGYISIPHYWYMPLTKYACHSFTYMSNCISTAVYIWTQHYCMHPSKINKLQHLFIILLQNIAQLTTTNIPVKCHMPKLCTVHHGGSMSLYMQPINSLASTI